MCKNIWPNMLGIFLTHMVTLSLFPGILSEIQPCSLGDWMPIILITTFYVTALVGKVEIIVCQFLFSISYFQILSRSTLTWSHGEVVLWPLSRLVLLPLLVVCVAPHQAPLFSGEPLPLFLTAVLGLTSGLLSNLHIILTPSIDRELAGSLMIFSYCSGLTLGSLISYGLDNMLGSQYHPCLPPQSSHPHIARYLISLHKDIVVTNLLPKMVKIT